MKLVRYGAKGSEKPGPSIAENGNIIATLAAP